MEKIELWFATHPVASSIALAIVGLLATGFANWFARLETPEKWATFKQEHPRLAALVSLLRGLGFDGSKVWRAIATLATGKHPEEPPPPSTKPSPKLPPLACIALVTLSGCGTKGPIVADVVNLADAICHVVKDVTESPFVDMVCDFLDTSKAPQSLRVRVSREQVSALSFAKSCDVAQKKLNDLSCSWAHSPAGVPFSKACRDTKDAGVSLAPACIAKAKSCAEANQCRP